MYRPPYDRSAPVLFANEWREVQRYVESITCWAQNNFGQGTWPEPRTDRLRKQRHFFQFILLPRARCLGRGLTYDKVCALSQRHLGMKTDRAIRAMLRRFGLAYFHRRTSR